MNAKALIPLIVGLGIAGLAAKLGFDFIKKAEGKQTKMVKLWAPVQDIKRGVSINETMVQPLEFPASAAPSGALADLEKIVGRVPHTGAPAGLPILDSMLLPPGVSAGLRVPPGFRAVAVKIDESSGVDNHLEPGCFVDVVGLFSIRRGSRNETIARTILEDVEVAAVGERLTPSVPTEASTKSGGKSSGSKREQLPRAVTLLVKPAQVPTLHLAEQKGKIKLSMRGAQDEGVPVETAAVDESQLLGTDQEEGEPKPQPSWRDKFDGFVSSLWKKNEPPPEPKPQPQPVAHEQPDFKWRMSIYNGDELKVLGWLNLDDPQAIVLGSEGPNIFQDPSRPRGLQFPPARPTKARSSSRTEAERQSQVNPPEPADSTLEPKPDSQSGAQTETDTQTESEPEELFE